MQPTDSHGKEGCQGLLALAHIFAEQLGTFDGNEVQLALRGDGARE